MHDYEYGLIGNTYKHDTSTASTGTQSEVDDVF